MQIADQQSYFVVTCTLRFGSFAEAAAAAPADIAAHISRSRALHEARSLLLSGAFLDGNDVPLTTMAVAT